MAVVPRGVIIGMLFYLTFAVAGTIWISMKYLSENGCDCRQYFERNKLSSSLQEHDFLHTQNEDKIASKQRRTDTTSLRETEKGTHCSSFDGIRFITANDVRIKLIRTSLAVLCSFLVTCRFDSL